MKILHVNYSDSDGGAAIAVKRLHDILSEKKINSNLLVSEKKTYDKNVINIPKNAEKIKNLLKDSFNRKLIKFTKKENFGSHSLNLIPSKLLTKINNFNADVVNLHWIGNETISIKDINKIKSKIVWTLHDMWSFCGTEHYASNDGFMYGYKKKENQSKIFNFDIDRYIWSLKKKNFKNINKIICTSNWMYDKVKESNLFKDKQIKIIPLPIDQNFWEPVDQISAKKILNINEDEKLLVFGADNFIANKRKGFELFIDSIKILKQQKRDYNFKILTFGEKKNLDNYKSLNIQNLGYINDDLTKKIVFSAADVTVIPSTMEAFGLVAQEATHCGSPCVVFDNTGLTSIIDNKKNGYLANFKSSKSLAEGVAWCLNEMNYKQNTIYDFTKKKFNTENIIDSYVNFLTS